MKDKHHPFFRPLWRRVLVVAICFGWAIVELVFANPTWALISAAIGAYGVWVFFVTYEPVDEAPGGADDAGRRP